MEQSRIARLWKLAVLGIAALALSVLIAACGGDSDDSSAAEGDTVAESCTPEHEFETVKDGVLTVSTTPILPYYDYSPGEGARGIEAKVLERFAEMQCLEQEVQVLSGAAGLQAVTSGRADLSAGGWYKTAERGKEVGQTDPVYYDFVVIVSRDGYSSISELDGKRVGAVQGSVFVDPANAVLGDGTVKEYQLADALFADLENERLDAIFFGSAEAGYLIQQKGIDDLQSVRAEPEEDFEPSMTAGEVNFPHTKGNEALTTALNESIAEMREDGTVKDALAEYGLTDPEIFQITE